MKKIYLLAGALLISIGTLSAQEKATKINKKEVITSTEDQKSLQDRERQGNNMPKTQEQVKAEAHIKKMKADREAKKLELKKAEEAKKEKKRKALLEKARKEGLLKGNAAEERAAKKAKLKAQKAKTKAEKVKKKDDQ